MARGSNADRSDGSVSTRSHPMPYVDADIDLSKVSPAAIRAFLEQQSFEMIDDGKHYQTWVWAGSDPEINPDDLPAVPVPHERDQALNGYKELLGSAVIRLSWIVDRSQADVCASLQELD